MRAGHTQVRRGEQVQASLAKSAPAGHVGPVVSEGTEVKAVILSAGQGKRLLPLTEARPKCLLPVSGRTILEWQVRALAANGIGDITVVTGFEAAKVDHALQRMHVPGAEVRALFNPFYAVADNVGSCYVARPEMTGDVVLLNGDTLFEPRVLAQALAGARRPITVTIDRKARYDSDDMKVRSEGDRLTAIGKSLALDEVDAESIGMLVFRGTGARRFQEGLEAVMRREDGLTRWYLSVVNDLAAEGIVGTASIEGLEWGEVDFPVDVARAEALTAGWAAGETAAVAGG